MSLSVYARKRGLAAAVAGDLFVGLASGKEDGALLEIADHGYRRAPVDFGDPRPASQRVEIRSSADVRFSPWPFDAQKDLRYWFIIDTPDGSGNVIASGEIPPRQYIDPATNALMFEGEMKTARASAIKAGMKAETYDATLRYAFVRPRAGEDVCIPAEALVLYIEDAEGT